MRGKRWLIRHCFLARNLYQCKCGQELFPLEGEAPDYYLGAVGCHRRNTKKKLKYWSRTRVSRLRALAMSWSKQEILVCSTKCVKFEWNLVYCWDLFVWWTLLVREPRGPTPHHPPSQGTFHYGPKMYLGVSRTQSHLFRRQPLGCTGVAALCARVPSCVHPGASWVQVTNASFESLVRYCFMT